MEGTVDADAEPTTNDDQPDQPDQPDDEPVPDASLMLDDAAGQHTLDPALLVYETFVAQRGPALVRLARGLLRDPYLAEDVVQEVLARAMLQWARVSSANDVDAYVRRMVVNACTSWFRRAARRERVTDQGSVLDRAVTDRTDTLDDRELLVALLRKLPAKQRAVLVLRHYEGLPDAEIAQVLGSTEVTVRSNAHRGLARLRELIAETQPAARPSTSAGPSSLTSPAKTGRFSSARRPRRPSL